MHLYLRSTILTAVLAGALQAQANQPAEPGVPAIPADLSTLADQPATHTGFVFDRSQAIGKRGLRACAGVSGHATRNPPSNDEARHAGHAASAIPAKRTG